MNKLLERNVLDLITSVCFAFFVSQSAPAGKGGGKKKKNGLEYIRAIQTACSSQALKLKVTNSKVNRTHPLCKGSTSVILPGHGRAVPKFGKKTAHIF